MARQRRQLHERPELTGEDEQTAIASTSARPPTVDYVVSSLWQHPTNLHLGLTTSRRRSVSTGDINPAPQSAQSKYQAPQSLQIFPVSQGSEPCSPGTGPIRPRINRFHSLHHGSHPRIAPWETRQSLPRSLSNAYSVPADSGLPANSQKPYGSLPSPRAVGIAAQPSRSLPLALPLPLGRAATSPVYNYRVEATSEGKSLAYRRNNRLPSIKLVLDIADKASSGLSPTTLGGPSSVHSCPSLSSPFNSLQLDSPFQIRTGYSEGAPTSYFEAKTPMQDIDPSAITPAAYTFGKSFSSSVTSSSE